MLFAWPTMEQIAYRIMRLRRLIAVAVALPMIVLLTVASLDPMSLPAAQASIAAIGIAMVVVGHVVLFPNVTLETIALSLSSASLVIAMPLIKSVSLWAPAEHATAVFILLMALAVAATGVVMALFQILLGGLVFAGPALARKLETTLVVPCSPSVARQQFALQPDVRRGRILTGPADDKGFFDVAVAVAGMPGDNGVNLAELVRIDAKVLSTTPARHDVMMVLRNGTVTVTSQHFRATAQGCEVKVSDLPGDFTAGMHVLFWLTDQQADNLTETVDMITGQAARANGLAHNLSLLSVAGTVLSPHAPATHRAD